MSENPKVGAVIVTYNPDAHQLEKLLSSLIPQVQMGVVVDNGSENQEVIVGAAKKWGVEPIPLSSNIGLAAAQNVGIASLMDRGASHILLSDQDSTPHEDMVARLLACLQECAPMKVAAVGPVPLDTRSAGDGESPPNPLVSSFTKWGPKRLGAPRPGEVWQVPYVIASGSLLPVSALREVGPMNEGLFIDQVDFAWGLRAEKLGYVSIVCGGAGLTHSLGEATVRLPWGQEIHVQSPLRNYYMVRNTLYMIRAPFMSPHWKLGRLAFLAKYLGFYAVMGLVEPERYALLGRGLKSGLAAFRTEPSTRRRSESV